MTVVDRATVSRYRSRKALEDRAVVAVAIAGDHAGARDQQARVDGVLGTLQQVGDISDAVDEHEAAQARPAAER